MAKKNRRGFWATLRALFRGKRPIVAAPVAAERERPSWTQFLRFLPEESEAAHANAAIALEFLFLQGQLKGSPEQHWLVDQLLRRLTDDRYEDFLDNYSVDEEFGLNFDWPVGTPPKPVSTTAKKRDRPRDQV